MRWHTYDFFIIYSKLGAETGHQAGGDASRRDDREFHSDCPYQHMQGIISARLLGPSGRGELASILLGLQLISLLSIVGLPTSSIFYLKKALSTSLRLWVAHFFWQHY